MLFSTTTNTKPTTTKTTKTPPPTPPRQQKKSNSHKNQNRTEREIGSWVSGEVEGSKSPAKSKVRGSKALCSWVIWALGSPAKSKIGSWVRGTKALGRRRSRRLVVAGNGLFLSLSLCVFQKMRFEGKIKTEMTLHPTHGQTEKHFRKMYFPCAIKHLHLRKSISGNHFHPKQMQSQSQFLFYPKYIILPVSPKKHFLQITFNEVPMINNVV